MEITDGDHGYIVMTFWNKKFIGSLNDDHKLVISENKPLHQAVFCEVTTWFESYMTGRFENDDVARTELDNRLQRYHMLYLDNDEIDRIME